MYDDDDDITSTGRWKLTEKKGFTKKTKQQKKKRKTKTKSKKTTITKQVIY